ncbi:enoyl-CoA hydratase-related protein [Nocardia sp. alder85J]|uniref:enoyl-CoA hydratase-related protein n=1 Tax=Nocardia sp. alder85J TaxID=2862949 RepID=UPI001CD58D27|nr:enoyl-CoA hydratase-related protein [Nocardia sp. alder85J]MCX4095631.1 enoyl-CoA hydratase-related protein [Nocardia sp. alder85J]
MTAASAPEPPAVGERRGPVAIIRLNRPAALNSVNADLSAAVGALLEEAATDPDVRVVVLTGTGRAFCAGADLKAVAAGLPLDAPDHPEWGFAGYVRHWIDKPTIAAVNGFALGGGTELVLASDLAVVDESAKLGLPEVSRGLFAAGGGVLRLQSQISPKLAAELVFTGKPIAASEAERLGLINRVAPAGTALDVALELADAIAGNAPMAVRESKALLHRTAHRSSWDAEVWDLNAAAMRRVFTSADAKEGATAFAEKRPAVWSGR